jgi:hypothetical protein
MKDDDEIIFDRDTSKPKDKFKKRKIRKEIFDSNMNESNLSNNIILPLDINKVNKKEDDNNQIKDNKSDLNSSNDKNNLNNDNNISKLIEEANKSKNSLEINNIRDDNNKFYDENLKTNIISESKLNSDIKLNTSRQNSNMNNIKTKYDKDELEQEYKEALNSGNKERIIIILQKKVEYFEFYINDLNLLIKHLKNDIHKKEKILNLLNNTNNDLKKSLNNFSKQLDKKIFNYNNNKTMKNSKSVNKISNIKNKNYEQDILTEYDKILNKNKILQKENDNLKNLLDISGKVEKFKELENLNKSLKEENNKLAEEVTFIKKEITDHSYCEKKRNSLLEKIKYLTEENKMYRKEIKKLTNIQENKIDDNNNNLKMLATKYLNTSRSHINAQNYKKISNLPKINNKNKNQKKIEELENLSDKNELNILIQLFQGDEIKYNEFKKKLIIYAKCKENIINKYKSDEKSNNKKVFLMQEQIQYLNHKVKESEMKINIVQQQLKDKDNQNKKLKKQLNEEKKVNQNNIQKSE